MWLPLLLLFATPSPVRVAVVDVSASDAVYEDVSRALADDVVHALLKAGALAERIDERELPEAGCRAGRCLEKVARAHQAEVLVTLDAVEDGEQTKVGVLALNGRSGIPVTAVRYVVSAPGGRSKPLTTFAGEVVAAVERERAAAKKQAAPRAGPADAGASAPAK